MMKQILLGLLFIVSFLGGIAQDNPVLMTVNDVPVYKYEFEQIFWKNKKEDVASKEDLDEYLELFTKFKLKVTEAEELGLDTVSKFVRELEGYKIQLQKPYLVDNKVNEDLIQEAYDRISNEVRASHILLLMKGEPSPEDTLEMYNEMLRIREEILSGKISFNDAAVKYSEDNSVKMNGGDLGYFTAFRMVYPFESAAFNTPVGEISMPFRTRFGYHIVKPIDKRKGRGTVKVSHIMVLQKKNPTATDKENTKKKIQEIYEKVMAGEPFDKMAREYSDDRQSAARGGELKWIKPGETFFAFDSTAFSLKMDGDISNPIQTEAGWHIIRRLDYKPVGDLESLRSELKNKIQKDSRSQLSKKVFVNKLKKEYGFKEKKQLLKKIEKFLDSSIVIGKWEFERTKKLNKIVASFGPNRITLNDIAQYIATTQRPMDHENFGKLIDEKYERFIFNQVMQYEKTQLESKYPEYRALLKEYRDGILLFEITDQKVWSKGVRDTTGLKEYYEANKQNYLWPDRVKAKIYSSSKKEIVDEAYKLVKEGKLRTDSIINYLNKDSQLNLKFQEGVFELKENEFITDQNWNAGINEPREINGKFVFVEKIEDLPSSPKKLDEAKGIITAAYQDELEANWIENLRKKYKVTVNKEVLYTIKDKPLSK